MSPAADLLYTAVTYADEHGRETYGYAMVPTATPGLVVHDDWDALGMRASGSNSVSFDQVRLPRRAPCGAAFPSAARPTTSSATSTPASSTPPPRSAPPSTHTRTRPDGSRATATSRTGAPARSPPRTRSSSPPAALSSAVPPRCSTSTAPRLRTADLTLLFAEAQAAKTFVGEAAVRIVDRALALSGGAGYLNGSPLARAYRDVRATAFMHPLGANRAYDYLGELALGGTPSLH